MIIPFNKESPVRTGGKTIDEEKTPVKEEATPMPANK